MSNLIQKESNLSVARPINVLVVNPFETTISGNDEVLVRVMEKMDRARFRFIVVHPGPNPYVERYRDMGAEVLFMRMSIIRRDLRIGFVARYFLDFFPTVYRFIQICRKYQIDVVHTNTTQILGAGLAAKLLGLPSIYHVHSLSISRPEWIIRLLNKWFKATSDMMFANSPVTAALFLDRGYPPEKMKVVWNPIDVDAFNLREGKNDFRREIGFSDDAVLVGIVGRIARIKFIEHFIRACALLKDRFPSARFAVIGAPNTKDEEIYLKELMDMANSLGLEKEVFFTVKRTYIPKAMQSLNILAHTCLHEGFGLVVGEAMAAGIPVVAAETGAMPYLVDKGRTGFLVPFGDSQAMADAIAVLITDPERSKEMGKMGREKANKLWRAENVADSMALVYHQLFKSKLERRKKYI